MSPLEELQGLVHSRNVLDVEVRAAAGRALDAGVHRSSVAFALGISRASLYRQFRAGGMTAPESVQGLTDDPVGRVQSVVAS